MSTVTSPVIGNLLYTEIEEELRSSVRSLLDKSAPWDAVLARTESDDPVDAALWSALAHDVGCAGLPIPEEFGGAGAGWREVAVVAEELGRSLAPVPFLGHTLAVAALLELQDRELLEKIGTGALTVSLAMPLGSSSGVEGPGITVRDGALEGRIVNVADAALADALVVPADSGLYLVQTEAPTLSRTPIVSLDMTRPLCDIEFNSVAATELATGERASTALRRGLLIGTAMLTSEQLGVAEKCLSMTVEYLQLRKQFGRTIGSYQALKHRVADLWVQVTQSRAAARYAAECAATDSADLAVAVAVAKAHCSAVVQMAAEECIQLHGGIGFTWEHPAHLYLKRAKSSAIALGGPAAQRALLAELVDLPGLSS